jgi:predicted aspartyl protease
MATLAVSVAAQPPVAIPQVQLRAAAGQISGRIPFKLHRGFVVVVEGSLGPLSRRRLMIDTGANPTVIDSSVARQLGLGGQATHLALLNGDARVRTSVLSSLTLGPITATSLPVSVADLGFIDKDLGTRIDAIVGLDVLQASSFTIDYEARKIMFGPVPPSTSSVPFETGPPFVTVRMDVQGETVRLLVDTGASGLTLFRSEHDGFGRLATLQVQSSNNISGILTREQVELPDARLGNLYRRKQAAYLVRPQKDVPQDFDGLMGIPALGLKQIAFDFERARLSWK